MEENFYKKWAKAFELLNETLREEKGDVLVLGEIRITEGDAEMKSLRRGKEVLEEASNELKKVISLLDNITRSKGMILEAAEGKKKKNVERRLDRIKELENITKEAIDYLNLKGLLNPKAFHSLKKVYKKSRKIGGAAPKIRIERTTVYII